jgi:N-acetylglutamate synthase-like GNAT family acetyltransferase
MIDISKTTKKEIKKFNEKEWHGVDIEHYGKRVYWKKKNFMYKALEDGKIVGILAGKHESGVIYIDELIVAAGKRGQGIGKTLIIKAEELAKEFNASKIHLITGRDWKARKFYDSIGFKMIAVLPKHHFNKDFVIYEKFV